MLSVGFCRGSRVEGNMSRVEGKKNFSCDLYLLGQSKIIEINSKEEEQTLAQLTSAHRWLQAKCQLRQNNFNKWIGGFHVTQVSLIITQVKNEIAYHSIN